MRFRAEANRSSGLNQQVRDDEHLAAMGSDSAAEVACKETLLASKTTDSLQ